MPMTSPATLSSPLPKDTVISFLMISSRPLDLSQSNACSLLPTGMDAATIILRSTVMPSTSKRSTPISSIKAGMFSTESLCFSCFNDFKCVSASSMSFSTVRRLRTSWLSCFPVPVLTLVRASLSSKMSSNMSIKFFLFRVDLCGSLMLSVLRTIVEVYDGCQLQI